METNTQPSKPIKKSSFTDPAANAKSCGGLLIILGVFLLLGVFIEGLVSPIYLLSVILLIVTGYGLYKKKKYGLYLFFVQIGISAWQVLMNLMNGVAIAGSVVVLVITCLLTAWFWSSRRSFS